MGVEGLADAPPIEIQLLRAKGVPEGSIVCIRLGKHKKQVQVGNDKIVSFPATGDRQHMKVDVYRRMGHARLLTDLGGVVCALPLQSVAPGPEDSSEMSLEFSLKGGTLPSSPAEEPEAKETHSQCKLGKRLAEVKELKGYLAKYGIEDMMQTLLRSVLKEKPEDPFEFMMHIIDNTIRARRGSASPGSLRRRPLSAPASRNYGPETGVAATSEEGQAQAEAPQPSRSSRPPSALRSSRSRPASAGRVSFSEESPKQPAKPGWAQEAPRPPTPAAGMALGALGALEPLDLESLEPLESSEPKAQRSAMPAWSAGLEPLESEMLPRAEDRQLDIALVPEDVGADEDDENQVDVEEAKAIARGALSAVCDVTKDMEMDDIETAKTTARAALFNVCDVSNDRHMVPEQFAAKSSAVTEQFQASTPPADDRLPSTAASTTSEGAALKDAAQSRVEEADGRNEEVLRMALQSQLARRAGNRELEELLKSVGSCESARPRAPSTGRS